MEKSFDQKHQRRQRDEPAEPRTTSSSPLILPNPYGTDRSSRGNRSGLSSKQNPSNINGVAAGKGGDVPRSHGYSSSRRAARDATDDFQQRDRSIRDPQAKTSKNNNDSPAQGRIMGKSSMDAQKRGFRGARSAPNSAGKSKPAQTDLAPFEVKMADFPELAGVPLGRAGPALVQKECWGPNPPSVSPQTQKPASPWKTDRKASPTKPDPQPSATDAKPDSSAGPPGQPVVTSWANVASQPPKKPVAMERTNGSNHMQSFDQKHQRRQRDEPAEPRTASSSPLILPNPYGTDRSSRGNRSGLSSKQNPSNINGVAAGKGGDVPRSHGYSSSRRAARDATDDFQQRDRSIRDPQAKTSKNNNDSPAQGRIMGKSSMDAQKRGFRGARSAPNSAGKSKPAQTDLAPFEVKMADFPELAGVPLGRAGPALVQKECWGPNPPSVSPQTQKPASPWKTDRKASPTKPDPQPSATDAKPDSSAGPPGQPVVTSWANVASQPPKKPVAMERTNGSNHMQSEDVTAQQEEGASGKKKRKKKKKKAKGAGDDVEVESEEPAVYQEPPKFEDEEEFPGLTLAFTGTTKLCNEENQRESVQHQFADHNKEKTPAAKPPTDTAKKGQKAEKVSGKKSKVPVQLDIGNMLAVLEKKQQSQKAKQDVKQVISVGGGLPVIHKQPSVQKKPLRQQDKIAHNPLDSTSPLVKKGKQREVPKAKKPTALKKVILKEREERKQRRLLEERGLLPEERGLLPEEESKLTNDAIEEEQCDANLTDEDVSPVDDNQPELNDTDQTEREGDGESNTDETVEDQTTAVVPCSTDRPKIHSRKFREYCSQMLSKDVDECVTTLLKELVRFQDRLYQKDPMKARMKRRLVMGLREVLKHLKLRKVKCVIISPNCERIQSKGGLDEALHNIIDTCREQGVPFVFALSRKALGRCVNKAVPVSLVGIFNYDGAQDFYHKMIELSSEARKAYEVMVLSLEQTNQSEDEQAEKVEINDPSLAEQPDPDTAQPEEPEYIKIWKKMLEKDCNHTFLNFEKQLSDMHLDSECYENTDEDEKS